MTFLLGFHWGWLLGSFLFGLAAGWVAVDKVDRLPLAVGQRGDALACRTLDVVLHGG